MAWLRLPIRSVGVTHAPRWLIQELDDRLVEISAAVEEGRAHALVLENVSAASAGRQDLSAMLESAEPEEVIADVLAAQRTLRRLEQLPIPTVAAIDGDCIGAVLELTLACSYRLASSSPATRFALPQVRLGLIPGLGGTVRLPRLVGAEAGLRFILRGELADSVQAKEMGLVDGVISAGRFQEFVAKFAHDRLDHGRLRTRARRGLPRRLLEDTAPGRRLLFSRAAREGDPRRMGRDAERAALQSVADGLSLPLEEAFAREAQLYGRLLATDAAKSLIHAALLDGEASHPHPTRRAGVERVGILSADSKAAHLAWLFARHGFAIRLKDRERAALSSAADLLESRLKDAERRRPARKRVGAGGGEKTIQAAVGFGGFGTLGLVLSLDDEPNRVAAQLQEAERHVTDQCLIASISPLVQVDEWASALRDPSRALGLIPTEAPDLFPAVEIAAGVATNEEAVAKACTLVRRLGGTPVHVADRSGYLTYRLVAVFLWQAAVLVHEGAGIAQVDQVAESFGFRMGPFRRADAVGSDGVRRLMMIMPEAISETEPIPELLEWVARRDVRFYRYRKGRPAGVDPFLPAGVEIGAAHDRAQILDRLLLATLNEAARALDEGLVRSTADLDLIAVFGLGYPRRRGGLLFQADRLGLPVVEEKLRRLGESHGAGFDPAPLIRALAAAGDTFYGRELAGSGQSPDGVLT